MRAVRRPLMMLIVAMALPALAWAQQTGSISGTVFDQTGKPLIGATVNISGEPLRVGRSTTTGDNGQYVFTLLLPGTYTVEASGGPGTSKRTLVVEVDRDTQADMVLGLVVEEALEVTAKVPVVDLKSTEVAVNFKRDELEALPLERSYRGLFQLIPGVADNRSTVGPSAGGSRQDNTYLIDGVNITNPGYGYLSTEVNELDIAEVNIKRAGISAEFGRTAGAVTNAVSKSGTNSIAGIARIDLLPSALISADKDRAFRDSLLTTVVSPTVGLGGPFVRDKLFWYGSARYFRETKWDRQNKLGEPLPDEKRNGSELYGKMTATPVPRHVINASYRHRPNNVGDDGLGSGTRPGIAYETDNSSRVGTATWGYFLTDLSSIDVKYLYLKEKNESVPSTDLGFLPTPFNAANPALMGQYDDPNLANVTTGGKEYTNRENYQRHEVKGTFTQFFDLGPSNHQLKVGGGYEFDEYSLSRLANGWGAIVRATQSGQPVLRARYYTEQPPQDGEGRTWALFLQDNVTMGARATLNLGLLANRDQFGQSITGSGGCPTSIALRGGAAVYDTDGDRCTFLRFDFADELQPRLGLTYNVRHGQGDKVYANWGRYYNMDQKSSSRSLAPRRIFQTQSFFTLTGSLLSTAPLASTTGKLIDPDIKPIYSNEFLVGYATPVRQNASVDVFFIYRDMRRFIEDVPSVPPDTGPYAAANLPCQRFVSCQDANATRTFKAFTIEAARRLANRWSTNVSYTWSRFEGNFDLDYSSAIFNTSSFIQDGPGTNVDEPNRFGPLLSDRPHVFKVFATYAATDALTFGGYLRAQSGTPWNARGRDTQSGATLSLNYLEPAGSRRNPTWTNVDLLASYDLRVRTRKSLKLEARLLNVFGNQTRLSTDPQQFLDFTRLAVSPYIGPYTQPNPFFGTANGYAPPRRLVLAAIASF